jgi:hypothetical protein
MSNCRRLRPHEQARRDQMLADAKARLYRGEGVIWTDAAEPGTQCCWCDCPWDPHDPSDRHARPGYLCPYPCPAEADYIIVTVLSDPKPEPLPLCERRYGDWNEGFAKLVQPAHVDIVIP